MIKIACVDIFNTLKAKNLLFKVMFCNLIHDEVLLEANKETAPAVAIIVANAMERAGNYFCETIKFNNNGKLPIKAELCTWWEH